MGQCCPGPQSSGQASNRELEDEEPKEMTILTYANLLRALKDGTCPKWVACHDRINVGQAQDLAGALLLCDAQNSVKKLLLMENNLSEASSIEILNAVKTNSALKSLGITGKSNDIGQGGVEVLGEMLSAMPSLVEVTTNRDIPTYNESQWTKKTVRGSIIYSRMWQLRQARSGTFESIQTKSHGKSSQADASAPPMILSRSD